MNDPEHVITLKCTKCRPSPVGGYFLELTEVSLMGPNRRLYTKVEDECELGRIGTIDIQEFQLDTRIVSTLNGILETTWIGPKKQTQAGEDNLKLDKLKPALEFKQVSLRVKVEEFVARNIFIIPLFLIIGYFTSPYFIDRFTSVDILTQRIYERENNIYKFNGAKCNDGWTSSSQGSGTCSNHDGVDYYFYEGDYIKSIEKCRLEAVKLSWID